MLTNLLILLAVAFLILIGVILAQPSDFRYARSITIAAPPEQIFPYLNDVKKNQLWSPWVEIDPNASYSFAGPEAGIGASVHWSGNNQIGEGTATITDSVANERVVTRLDFKRPMQSTALAEQSLKPVAGGTEVTWSMSGRSNFVGKAIGLFMNCEKMMDGQFDKGLGKLKTLIESRQP